jgi:hypothetical protein
MRPTVAGPEVAATLAATLAAMLAEIRAAVVGVVALA